MYPKDGGDNVASTAIKNFLKDLLKVDRIFSYTDTSQIRLFWRIETTSSTVDRIKECRDVKTVEENVMYVKDTAVPDSTAPRTLQLQ